MAKRDLLLFSLVLALLFLSGINTAFGDVSAQLKQAENLTRKGDYEQAEQLYQEIVADNPSTDYGLEAQEKLTCLYVAWGKEPQTQAGLDKLLSDFSGRDGIGRAVTHVADAYRGVEKHTRASDLYRDVIARWPNDEHAMWSQIGLAMSHASLADDAAAERAYEELRTEYANSEHISRAVCLIADNYRRLERSDKARGLYEYTLANWPDAEFALWSQMGLAISNIQVGDVNAADVDADKLCTGFSSDARTPIAVCMVADEYRKSNEHERANLFYQHVVSTWPDAEHALWSQMGLAISSIRLGDYEAGRSAVEKLFADFFEDERMAVTACLTADEYRKAGKHEDALPLYQYVVNNWPDAEHAMWSQMGLAVSSAAVRNNDVVVAAVDRLSAGFSAQPRFPLAVFEVGTFVKESEGQDAQSRVYHQKAIAQWERVITELPVSITTAWAYDFAADSYRRLGQYDQAIAYYETVVDNWPDYEYAWHALFRIGRCHDAKRKSGLISKSVAKLNMRPVYERLLEEYPDCKMAGYVRRWLNR